MFYALTWLLMAVLMALWSGAAWALHALAAGSVAQASGLAGLPGQVVALGVPEWLAFWLPVDAQASWTAALAAFAPVFDYLLAVAPGLVAWAAPLIWVLWAVGGLILLLLGVAATLMIRAVERRLSPNRPLSSTPAQAPAF
jgi:hypothetical protein